MKLTDLKRRVCALLDIDALKNEERLCDIIDSVAKKTAVYTKCIKKSATIIFEEVNGFFEAIMPADFAAFYHIRGTRSYGRENFEIVSGKIRSAAVSAGEYELVYYAFPPEVNTQTDGDAEIFSDGYICDIVAYGAAMELCAFVYPEDVHRYIRLATEYDERMANALTGANDAKTVANGFFAGTRGVFI